MPSRVLVFFKATLIFGKFFKGTRVRALFGVVKDPFVGSKAL